MVAQNVSRKEGCRPIAGGSLTPREAQILEMISRGLTNGEIAGRIGVTVHAVKFHLNGIFRKLGVSNRTAAAVRFAQAPELGLASREAPDEAATTAVWNNDSEGMDG
jgi:DNA-binding CsgD family transcriptional regulator